MNLLNRLDEAICDDTTGKGSSTRFALMIATTVLTLGLFYAETMFAIQTAFDLKGADGWVTIINHLAICLATVLTGYATKIISSAIAHKDRDEQ